MKRWKIRRQIPQNSTNQNKKKSPTVKDDGPVMYNSASGAKSEQSDCMKCMTWAAGAPFEVGDERNTHE